MSEMTLLAEVATKKEALEIAATIPVTIFSCAIVWRRSVYESWKAIREEFLKANIHAAEPKFVLESTPNGSDSFFYRSWMDGGTAWPAVSTINEK